MDGEPNSAIKLPKGVYRQRKTLADGSIRVYYRVRSTGKRVIGEPGTPEFAEAATEAKKPDHLAARIYIARIVDILENSYGRMAQRGKKLAMEATLSRANILEMISRQGARCALTELEFDVSPSRSGRGHAPFRPSIDRIDSTKGYTPENCRIVCFAVNAGLNAWGDEAFLKIARAAALVAERRAAAPR